MKQVMAKKRVHYMVQASEQEHQLVFICCAVQVMRQNAKSSPSRIHICTCEYAWNLMQPNSQCNPNHDFLQEFSLNSPRSRQLQAVADEKFKNTSVEWCYKVCKLPKRHPLFPKRKESQKFIHCEKSAIRIVFLDPIFIGSCLVLLLFVPNGLLHAIELEESRSTLNKISKRYIAI